MTEATKKGVLFALSTAIISGLAIFYNKVVISGGIDPLAFNIIKNGGVAIIISLLIIFTRKLPKLKSLSKGQWSKLWLLAIVGGSIPYILYFDALRQVSAINANLIHKTLFIWVALMAIPILGERLSRWQVAGYILVIWSNIFIGGFSGFRSSGAEFTILVATIMWSAENIIAKFILRDTDDLIVAWGSMFLGSIILVAVAIIQHRFQLLFKVTPEQLIISLGSIVLLAGYVVTTFKSLRYAPANVVTAVLVLATPITNVLSAVFITHIFPNSEFVNLVATTAGIGLISLFAAKAGKRGIISPTAG